MDKNHRQEDNGQGVCMKIYTYNVKRLEWNITFIIDDDMWNIIYTNNKYVMTDTNVLKPPIQDNS
jgi:hypothetical protein